MPLPKEKIYTLDDIYALPGKERAELIDGHIYYIAPPSRKHQEISGELFGTIREYIKSKNGSCKTYIAPFAVFLNTDDRNYVDPDKNRVLVYTFGDEENENLGEYSFADDIPVGIYTDLIINLSKLGL